MAGFPSGFSTATHPERGEGVSKRQQTRSALEEIERTLQGLHVAIADGFRTPGPSQKLEETDARKAELETHLSAP